MHNPLLWRHHLPKAPPPKPVTLGVSLNVGRHIQTIELKSKKIVGEKDISYVLDNSVGLSSFAIHSSLKTDL